MDEFLALVVFVVCLACFVAGTYTETVVTQKRACNSACERRGTERKVTYKDICDCEDGTHLRADYGRMFR